MRSSLYYTIVQDEGVTPWRQEENYLLPVRMLRQKRVALQLSRDKIKQKISPMNLGSQRDLAKIKNNYSLRKINTLRAEKQLISTTQTIRFEHFVNEQINK